LKIIQTRHEATKITKEKQNRRKTLVWRVNPKKDQVFEWFSPFFVFFVASASCASGWWI